MDAEISAINQLKREFLHQDIQDLSVLRNVQEHLAKNEVLKSLPIVQAFQHDLETYIDSKGRSRLNLLKQAINSGGDYFVFSAFAAPYFKDLSLDAFYYKPIHIPDSLKAAFHSPAFPVNLVKASIGFSSQQIVALFPENHIDHIQLEGDRIFYFMDRFVSRFFKITQPVLKHVSPYQLEELRHASPAEIEYAASCWVHLHEYFHRQGAMPIPRFLDVKSNKGLAGLEELRVDLLSIITCIERPDLIKNSDLVAEFILAERLFRYGVESPAILSYDAISSQFLFKYLLDNEGIRLNSSGIVTLQPRLHEVLKKLSQEIFQVEKDTIDSYKRSVKNNLLNLVHQYVGYDSSKKNFLYHDYFKWLKQDLQMRQGMIH